MLRRSSIAWLCLAVLPAVLAVCFPAAAADPVDEAWRQTFDRPAVLAELTEPVVCYLNIQHPDVLRTQLQDKPPAELSTMKTKIRLAELSGLRCVMLHFTEVRPEEIQRPQVKALVISGRSKSVSKELDASFFPLIRETPIPILGFCGGMQLIGQAYEVKVGPLRPLREGETDPNPKYHPGQFKEWGFLPVQLVVRDPLFEGLPDELLVREMHAFQMFEPPPEFTLLASSPECRVQAIKHNRRMVYGVQFHPEAYDDEHPQGRTLIANFFRLIGLRP